MNVIAEAILFYIVIVIVLPVSIVSFISLCQIILEELGLI